MLSSLKLSLFISDPKFQPATFCFICISFNIVIYLFVTGVIASVLCCKANYDFTLDNDRSPEPFQEFYTEKSFDIKALNEFFATRRCNSCPRVYIPVCGDDDQTYTSECALRCSNHEKKKNPPVQITRRGMCRRPLS